MSALPIAPFEDDRHIGSVIEVTPVSIRANLPLASKTEGLVLHGNYFGAGEVGEFVCVECGKTAVLGRINQVKLPEKDRLTVEPQLGKRPPSHPIGTIQLLCSISISTGEVTPGITDFPRVGVAVYSAHPDLLSRIAEFAKLKNPDKLILSLATLAKDPTTLVKLTPEKLFGRHVAILGATGGGKSWTIARIIESLNDTKAKVILLDATGEYHTARSSVKHVHLGAAQPPGTTEEVVVPYRRLSIHDLIAMFRPSPQAQAPKLRAAMKTLKLLEIDKTLGTNGTFLKANQPKKAFMDSLKANIAAVEAEDANFDITKLALQIDNECCQVGGTNEWAGVVGNDISYCSSLTSRISSMISAPEFACIFRPGTTKSLFDALDDFLSDATNRVFRISLRNVSFASNAREIVANTIGKHLLLEAREGKFLSSPALVILDESHNFINRSIGDEFSKYYLDSFELIAREGRKFCLTICLATQRPRDLPESVLSQMGTMIVHRLTNNSDRDVVEKASGDIDRSAASFLPTLSPGEAILIGTDLAFPVSVKIIAPTYEPDSTGPNYQQLWS